MLRGEALALRRVTWPEALYLPESSVPAVERVRVTAIPYFANANRQPGEMQVWMPETADRAQPLPAPTVASRSKATASHCWTSDTVAALNDQVEPATSDDQRIPRFTWWDHRGTQEWVQYEFAGPTRVSAVEVYWWDERRIKAHCRVPQSWRVLYREGGEWRPVTNAGPYGVEMDHFNRVAFAPVDTTALRVEVTLQPDWSGGVLEWRVE